MGKHTDYGMPSGHHETEDMEEYCRRRKEMRIATFLLILASIFGALLVIQ